MVLTYRTRYAERARLAESGKVFVENATSNGALAFRCVPRGWHCDQMGPWTRVYPSGAWDSLPQHGWKIHVSATPKDACGTLTEVSRVCERHGVPFKHLRNIADYMVSMRKYADRLSGGKFITLYPCDNGQFTRLLEDLEARLRDKDGPYILTDVRYAAGPVFFRYGAFFSVELPSGRNGMTAPDGAMVEDARDLAFTVPGFVTVPKEVRHLVEGHHEGLKKGADNALFPYRVRSCMHYSYAGGVYRGEDVRDHREVVLKEARAFSGYTSWTESAQDRLRTEADALRRLQELGFVPAVRDYLVRPGHEFLVEDLVDGITLQEWLASTFPSSYSQPLDDYEGQALSIAEQLVSIVDRTHEAGLAIMDLQPDNIIIAPDGTVLLIDLEGVRAAAESSQHVVGTPGYVPLNAETGTNRDRDLFALYQVLLYMLAPSADSNLSPGLEGPRHRLVDRTYSTPVRSLLDAVRRRVPAQLLQPKVGLRPSWTRQEPSAVPVEEELCQARGRVIKGILESQARSGRHGVCFPGDARQIWEGPSAQWDTETGCAGILLALSRLGADTRSLALSLGTAIRPEDMPPNGLLRGLPGTAFCLAEAGEPDLAQRLVQRRPELYKENLNVRSGAAGTVLAYLSMELAGVGPLDIDGLTTCFGQLVDDEDAAVDGSGAETRNAVGLFDGWSGVAVACEALFLRTGESCWHQRARAALERDLGSLKKNERGELAVDMSGVEFSYLSEGSAGIGVACAVVDAQGYAETIEEISAVLGTRSLGAGLFLGFSGYAAALMAIGGSGQKYIAAQLHDLLSMRAYSFGDDDAIYFPGNLSFHLSADYSTGASGIALAVESYLQRRPLWVPWAVPLFEPHMKGGVQQ